MTIDAAGLDLLFREARTHNKFTDEPVSDETLHELYDLLKCGPTSANSSPARYLVPAVRRRRSSGWHRRCRPATWRRRWPHR